jgi:hypothetical protein
MRRLGARVAAADDDDVEAAKCIHVLLFALLN